jgi:hypothetical protein
MLCRLAVISKIPRDYGIFRGIMIKIRGNNSSFRGIFIKETANKEKRSLQKGFFL